MMLVALCFLMHSTADELANARHGLAQNPNAITTADGTIETVDAVAATLSDSAGSNDAPNSDPIRWSADHDCHGCTIVAALPDAPTLQIGSVAHRAVFGTDSLIPGRVVSLEAPPPKA
ncbi:hypothetical protein [Azorhizobium oxalatiphilum]|uniref:hypothetical protein n=1 Tax=Azorhizobium oxalatiphilum TaxID=980631 RepID=UPI00166A416A|nr:hypothetical protein [Azorhizobium oxalatiphilum]